MPDPRIFPVPQVNDGFALVMAVTTLVVAANPHRVDCEIVNDGASTVWLARGNAAVVGSGIRINANGGSYSFETANLFLGQINGITEDQDGVNVTVSEGTYPRP